MASNNNIPKDPENEYYEVRKTLGKGYGCFALKPIKRGVRILADNPLLMVRDPDYLLEDIKEAFASLSAEQKALYFSLYSGHGQNPKSWPSQIHPTVRGKERRRIQEQHDARISKTPTLISIFQTNCMLMNEGAAVFPHASRFNHSCNPNACFSWNAAIEKETIHMMKDIDTNDEITLSYCDMIHGKTLRSWELKHYGFACDCRACSENEDDESTFAYQSADRRFKLHELEHDTRFLRGRNLKKGADTPGFVSKLLQLAALHQQEGDFTARLANVFLDIALICEIKGDFKMAEVTAVKAVEVKRDCQGEDYPEYEKYAEVLQRIRAKNAVRR